MESILLFSQKFNVKNLRIALRPKSYKIPDSEIKYKVTDSKLS